MAALRTPLYDWHVVRGGRMVEFADYSMPVQFAGVSKKGSTSWVLLIAGWRNERRPFFLRALG